MAYVTISQDQLTVTVRAPEIELAFSLENGGLRGLRRLDGPNVVGYGEPRPSIDVRINDADWLASRSFVRYLNHWVDERDGGIEVVILIGIGPLVVHDRYRITGTLIARRATVENVGEDNLRLWGVRLELPWARVGAPDTCRFDAPGNSVRPRVPLFVVANQRRNVLPRRFFAPGLRDGRAIELAPTHGTGLMALHSSETEDTLLCWYYSGTEPAQPMVEGNESAVTLIHQIDLADWLGSGVGLSGGTQYILLLREPWPSALAAFQRTQVICGVRLLHNPAGWVRDAALYEVHPSQYGGFRGLADALPELRDLQINTLCLMPIWEFANLKGRLWDGNWEGSGNPYAIRDFDRLDRTLGTEDDLRDLVRAAHESGMRVLVDLPLSGCATDSRHMDEHPEWFCYDERGRPTRVPRSPQIVSFDWASQSLQDHMLGWALGQVRSYDLDGFRVAGARTSTVNWARKLPHHASAGSIGPVRLIERLQYELKRIKGDAVLLGELCGPVYASGQDFVIDELPHHMFIHMAVSRVTPVELGEWLEDHMGTLPPSTAQVCFTESHHTRITNPLADGLRGSRISRMLLAGMVFSGFIPLIWCGQEISEYPFISRLLRLRARQPALRYGRVLYNAVPCDNGQIFAVLRPHEGRQLLGLLNVGPHKQTIAVSLPVDTLQLPEGEYVLYELLTDELWFENDRCSWQRDELLSMRLTVEPFRAYCFDVRAVTDELPAGDRAPELDAEPVALAELAHDQPRPRARRASRRGG